MLIVIEEFVNVGKWIVKLSFNIIKDKCFNLSWKKGFISSRRGSESNSNGWLLVVKEQLWMASVYYLLDLLTWKGVMKSVLNETDYSE
jgi:hypothetical protein